MDDYELDNARAWDDDLPPRSERQSDFEWQTVGASGKPAKDKKAQTPALKQHPHQQQQPSRIPARRNASPPEQQHRPLPLQTREARPPQQLPVRRVSPPRIPPPQQQQRYPALQTQTSRPLPQQRPRPHAAHPKDKLTKKFPKLASLTDELVLRADRKWEKDVEVARYRQFPPADVSFEAIGNFHWPTNEYQAAEVFGMNYEALDSLRHDNKCYIRFDDRRSTFQVCGNEKNVKKCLAGIRRTCFQLASRSINPVRVYLVHWRSSNSIIPSHVYLEDYPRPTIISSSTGADADARVRSTPRGQGYLEDPKQIEMQCINSSLSVARLKATIQNALRKLHYNRGNLQLRARLGIFLLDMFRPPEGLYELQEYLDMTKASQFKADVTHELGNRSIEIKLLEHFQQADDIFVPQDAQTRRLVDVKPVYSAVFIFKEKAGVWRLTMSWNVVDDEDGDTITLAEHTHEWSHLESDTGHELKLLDMPMVDLHTSQAWQFEITTSEVITERLPEHLRNFAKTVSIDPIRACQGSKEKPFVIFSPYAQLCEMRQSISYRYGIKGSTYTLDLTQFQERAYSERTSLAQNMPVTVYEPRWSVNVYSMDWDSSFAHNKKLGVEGVAPWSNDMEVWFDKEWGSEQDGFEFFMEKLVKIEEMIGGIAVEDEDE